ncbi:MAG: signal peptidase I [Pseudomonadales bacterium]|nr:signal peptidase I [Pseudomonadales bacterium]
MLIVRSSIVDWNAVPTASMKPTIIEGDRVIVDKLAYDVRVPFIKWSMIKLADPDRGDIVVINSGKANKRLIKRILAVPGDRIALFDNEVIVNDKKLDYQKIATLHDKFGSFFERIETIKTSSGIEVSYLIRVYVNQKNVSPLKNMDVITIPDGYYFVMGDNRHKSDDSRLNLKLVPRNEITGKASSIAFSLDYANYYLPRKLRWWVPL